VANVRFGHFQGLLLGKDAVKFRDGASNCRMASCQLRKVGMLFAVIEDAGTNDCAIENVDGELAGYDVIGEWLDGAPGSRNYTTATNGQNQTLNQTPGGLRLNNVARARLTGVVRGVRDAPHNGAEGNPVQARGCTDSVIIATVEDTDGLVRIGNNTRCQFDISATNVGRNGSNTTAAVYCDDSGSGSTDNAVKVVSIETSGAAVIDYPLRINGTGTGWILQASYIGPHDLPSGIVTRIDSATVARYSGGADAIIWRGSLTFDASAESIVTHNLGFSPSVQVSTEGSFFYEVDVTANTSTEVTFRLRRADDTTPDTNSDLVASTTRTVAYTLGKYRLSSGYPY
jgi:hypothetical protein